MAHVGSEGCGGRPRTQTMAKVGMRAAGRTAFVPGLLGLGIATGMDDRLFGYGRWAPSLGWSPRRGVCVCAPVCRCWCLSRCSPLVGSVATGDSSGPHGAASPRPPGQGREGGGGLLLMKVGESVGIPGVLAVLGLVQVVLLVGAVRSAVHEGGRWVAGKVGIGCGLQSVVVGGSRFWILKGPFWSAPLRPRAVDPNRDGR